MHITDPDDLDRVDQEIRINELKQEAEEIAGGEMVHWESEDMPPEIAEQFWKQVVEYEKAPWTSYFQKLVDEGVVLPPPEEMDDKHLVGKLWEIIKRLAGMHVFFSNTNHLSDRELYTNLWTETLHEGTKDVSFGDAGSYHIDLLGSGSEEDMLLYMKYYADDEFKAQWLKDFPDYEMPAHEDPAYERDRQLPTDEPRY